MSIHVPDSALSIIIISLDGEVRLKISIIGLSYSVRFVQGKCHCADRFIFGRAGNGFQVL